MEYMTVVYSHICDRFQGTANNFFSPVKDDGFMMVRSKGNVKVRLPYRECTMQLRSMTKRPSPYTHMNSLSFMNLHDDSTIRRKQGPNKIRVEGEDSPPIIIRSGCAMFPRFRYIRCCVIILLIILVCVVLINQLFPYPLHASCIIKWTFGETCTYTMQKFRCQILNWSSTNCGPHGNRCLYTLKEPKPDENNVIRAVHFAPNLKTMETMRIDFEEINNTCTATGESTSNEWFRVFDDGTNYCDLHNLVTGTGFDKSTKFLEMTNNAVCTQYTMAVCQ
ncbi:uncharacterized protein LOC114877845 [Osmia bicornis bicornis]|uniref:uncharacterized protein LOC114877845 n=1 Tax=Osmia bicornis bicornis TaxID=1437191 RepID=UPI0010F9BD92|nr:uncharacterized protein LOC114877845 [Osmia bicornis bicornis]